MAFPGYRIALGAVPLLVAFSTKSSAFSFKFEVTNFLLPQNKYCQTDVTAFQPSYSIYAFHTYIPRCTHTTHISNTHTQFRSSFFPIKLKIPLIVSEELISLFLFLFCFVPFSFQQVHSAANLASGDLVDISSGSHEKWKGTCTLCLVPARLAVWLHISTHSAIQVIPFFPF